MNSYEDVRKFLVEQAGNRTAIAAAVGGRIYPDTTPQTVTLDHIVIQEIDDQDFDHLGGRTGVSETRVQFDCKSEVAGTGASRAADLRQLIVDAFFPLGVAHRGTLGNGFLNGVTIAGRQGGKEPPIDGSDKWRYIRSLDLLLVHTSS